jgi:hypothetical protein
VSSPATLAAVAAVVVVLNVPFGFWRARTRKLSLPWFVAVHAPVPLVVATRLLAGVRWQLAVLPVLVGAYALGQFLGGRLRRRARAGPSAGPSAGPESPPC